jgi:hypothetical protein
VDARLYSSPQSTISMGLIGKGFKSLNCAYIKGHVQRSPLPLWILHVRGWSNCQGKVTNPLHTCPAFVPNWFCAVAFTSLALKTYSFSSLLFFIYLKTKIIVKNAK